MNPVHEKCGETLYTPKIYFKNDGKTTSENTDHYWCKHCRVYVKISKGIQEDVAV